MFLLILIVILLVVLPVAWLTSEVQSRRWVRITLGISSIALSFLMAWFVGMLTHFEYNAAYGFASSHLIDTVVTNIQAGNQDELLVELRRLKAAFQPTYEHDSNYGVLVERFVDRLKIEKPKDGSDQPSPSDGK